MLTSHETHGKEDFFLDGGIEEQFFSWKVQPILAMGETYNQDISQAFHQSKKNPHLPPWTAYREAHPRKQVLNSENLVFIAKPLR